MTTPAPAPATPFTDAELARRRRASRRLGWALGLAALAIYAVGMFFQR